MTEDLHRQGPALDRAHLDRMTGGDNALAAEVLGLFREQAEVWMRLLDLSAPTADWIVAAHTIKGSARGIGGWALAEVCGALEEAAKAGAMDRDAKLEWRDRVLIALDALMQDLAVHEHRLRIASLRA